MSRLKLISEIVAGYGSRFAFRDCFFRLNHKSVAAKLIQKGVVLHRDDCVFEEHGINEITNKEKSSIIALADKTLNNIFNYLGSGYCHLDPINWSRDFKSGFEWPVGTYYKRYKQVDLTNDADVKVPRELSRSHFLLHLALAYLFTKEDKYAKKAYELLDDWIDKNPLMYSINWGCAMDVAIRAVNWIWALPLLRDYDVDKTKLDKIHGSLYQHGWFIYHNFEGNYFNYNHNHYFSDLVGLIHIALIFKGDKKADKWFNYSLDALYREIRLQVLPCGMSYEGSSNYHRLLLELLLPTLILLKRNGVDVPPDIWGRLETMFDFVMNITMPNGEVPIIGDQDNGRCLPWGAEPINDERYLLSVGALLFGRGDMKAMGGGFNIYCVMFGGENAKQIYDGVEAEAPSLKSKFYRDAGLAILRNDDNYILFNADNQGMYRDTGTSVSHTHCDWLSFVLCVKGVPFIIDPGTYVYSSDAKMRNLFRSTKMHNTIVIDGQDFEPIPQTSLWGMCRKSTSIQTTFSKRNVSIATESTLCQPSLMIKRKIELVDNKTLIITDEMKNVGPHKIDSYLHFDIDAEIEINANAVYAKINDLQISIRILSNSTLNLVLQNSMVSKSYGSVLSSNVVILSGEFTDAEIVKMIIDLPNE